MKKFWILVILMFSLGGCANFDFSSGTISEEEKTQVRHLEGELVVYYLDVGQADAMFLELPNNEVMLIDAGEAKNSEKIINYIKELGYNKLDYVIGTHPHADHIGGLSEVIKSFDIGNIYMPKVVATSKTYENLLMTIKDKGLSIKTGKSGVEVINDGDLEAVMVAPNKDNYANYNNYSIVLKLVYGEASYLFTGDAEEKSESEITYDIDVDVLKVGHHGSETSNSSSFLAKVSPKYAIISVGEGNIYGHPSSNTIERLKKYTSNIYRTDLNGNIILYSDGKNIRVETEK